MIEQKGMTFDHHFCDSFSFSSHLFLGGKRKGEDNNQSRGQKSCLSSLSSMKKGRVKKRKDNIKNGNL